MIVEPACPLPDQRATPRVPGGIAAKFPGVCLAMDAMRTRFELLLPGEDSPRLRAAGEAALGEIVSCESRLSLFRPGSLVSRINDTAYKAAVLLDRDTFELLYICREVWAQSGGAFDITIGPLMRAWGFRGIPADPVAAETCAWGFQHIELDERNYSVRFLKPGLSIDLGGVGKGHALDLAAAELRAAGVSRAFLHAGTSSVLAIGDGSGSEGWRIAVSPDPSSPVVKLRDLALGVSAQRGRVIDDCGVHRGHILDPRTGRPAPGIETAAVVAPSAALADAWSTAVLVCAACPARDDLTGIIDRGKTASPRWVVHGPHADKVTARAGSAAQRS